MLNPKPWCNMVNTCAWKQYLSCWRQDPATSKAKQITQAEVFQLSTAHHYAHIAMPFAYPCQTLELHLQLPTDHRSPLRPYHPVPTNTRNATQPTTQYRHSYTQYQLLVVAKEVQLCGRRPTAVRAWVANGCVHALELAKLSHHSGKKTGSEVYQLADHFGPDTVDNAQC